MIQQVKCEQGSTLFLKKNKWTSAASDAEISAFHKKSKRKHFWDDEDCESVRRILAYHRGRYLVQYAARDLEDEWKRPCELSPDLIADFKLSKIKHAPVPFSVDLEQANKLYPDRQSPQKLACNELFASAIKNECSNGRVLYLDAPSMLTTRVLMAANIQERHSLIPINFNSNAVNWFWQEMETHGLENIAPRRGYLDDVAASTTMPICAIFADYCSTFYGTADASPKNDILRISRSRFLTSPIIWAFTFSLRTCEKGKTHKKQICEIKKWVQSCMTNVHVLHECVYAKNMYFVLFRIKPSQ